MMQFLLHNQNENKMHENNGNYKRWPTWLNNNICKQHSEEKIYVEGKQWETVSIML